MESPGDEDQGPMDIPLATPTVLPPHPTHSLLSSCKSNCSNLLKLWSPGTVLGTVRWWLLILTTHLVQEVGVGGGCSCFQMRKLRPGKGKSLSMVTQLPLKYPP